MALGRAFVAPRLDEEVRDDKSVGVIKMAAKRVSQRLEFGRACDARLDQPLAHVVDEVEQD